MSRFGRRYPMRWGAGLAMQRSHPPVVQGAAGAQTTRNVSDTGVAQSDSVAITLARLRGVTDTGVNQTDTVLSAETYDLHNPFQGTSGNVISTSNSGAGGTADFFDFVTGSPTYGTAHPNSGSTSMSCQTAAGAAACGWDVSIPTTQILYGRVYWFAAAANGATTRIISIAGDATSLLGNISLDTANRLTANIGGFGTTYVMPSAIPAGSMARIEWLATVDRHGNGKLTVRYFSAAGNGKDSLTPDDELIATNTGIADQRITSVQVGVTAAATVNTWFDDFEVSNAGWIGPFGGAQAFQADLLDNGTVMSDTIGRAVVRKVADTGESQTDTAGRQVVRPSIQDDGVGFGFTDTFTRTIAAGSGLGGSWTMQSGTLIWSVDGAEVAASPNAGQQIDASLDTGSPNHEVRTRVRWDVAPAGSSRNHGIRLRSDAAANNDLRVRLSVPAGGSGNVNLAVSAVVAGTATVIYNLPVVAGNPQAGEWWWIRAAAEGSRLRVWVWRDGTAQPITPDADLTDTTVPANNLVMMTAQRLAGETSTPVLNWDDFSWRVLDTVIATKTPAGVQTTRNVTDTGVSQSDAVARQVVRQVTSTGVTQTDSPGRAVVRGVADTGESQTDSIGPRQITRAITDYGLPKIASDDANRADQGPPPSASWDTDPEGIGAGGFTVTSNQLAPTSAVRNEMSWIADTFGPNVDMAVDVPTLPSGGSVLDLEIFSASSWATTLYDGYLAHYVQGTGLSLYRYTAGAPTSLASTSEALAAGDTYRLLTTPATVEVWRRSGGAWQQIISVADTTHRNAANRLAIYTTGNAVRLDNFLASSGNIYRDVVGSRQITRAVTSVGVSQSDSLARAIVRGVADTGDAQTDSVATTRGRLRNVTDTGVSQTDAVATMRARAVADTGVSQSDSVIRTAVRTRGVSDTGVAQSDTPTPTTTRTRPITDTGESQSDTLARTVVRIVADTGVAQSDSVTRARLITRNITDTGASQTDTPATARTRPITDTGEAQSDSLLRAIVRKVTDTGEAQTDSVARTRLVTRNVTDTGESQTDSIGRAVVRVIASTGVAQTDSVAASSGGRNNVSDTGVAQSDAVTRRITRGVASIGVTQTDSVTRTRQFTRNITDTGASQSDTPATARVRPIIDTGASQTDSPATTRTRPVTAIGVAQTDAVGRAVTRRITDTGESQTDALGGGQASTRNVTDQGVTQSDALARAITRAITTTGVAQTDAVAATRAFGRGVTDQGASQTDSVATSHGGGVTDTGAAITDQVSATKTAQRGPTDTGVAQTDAVRRLIGRELADQAVTQTDSLAVSGQHVIAVTDQGVSQSDSADTTSAGRVGVTDAGVSQTDQLRRALIRRIADVGVAQTDAAVILFSLHIFLSDRGVRFSDFVGAVRRVLTSVSGPTGQPMVFDGLAASGAAGRTGQVGAHGPTSQPIIYSHPKE